MTTDGNNTPATPPAAPAAAPTPPAASTPPPAPGTPPPPLSVEQLLEQGGEVKVDDLKPLLEQRDAALVARIENDLRQKAADDEARRRAADDQNAAAAADIEWAQRIFTDMDSQDPATAEAAKAEWRANEERYNRGRSLKYQRESSETQQRAVNEYMAPIWQGIREAAPEYQSLFAEVFGNRGDTEAMREAKGNWMLAAMKHAEHIGYERGKNESGDAADLNRRVQDGVQGPPGLGGGAHDDNSDLWNGIDRTQAGAAAEYQRRLQARQRAVPGR